MISTSFVVHFLFVCVLILDTSTSASSKWSQCQFCKLVITTVNLWRHIRTQHTDQPPLQCEYCQKSFKNKYSKREHIRKSELLAILRRPRNLTFGTISFRCIYVGGFSLHLRPFSLVGCPRNCSLIPKHRKLRWLCWRPSVHGSKWSKCMQKRDCFNCKVARVTPVGTQSPQFNCSTFCKFQESLTKNPPSHKVTWSFAQTLNEKQKNRIEERPMIAT